MEWIIEILVAILLLVCGVIVFKGNISIIHSYHAKNVTDVKGYGKAMGAGLLIMSVAPAFGGVVHMLELDAPVFLVPVVDGVIFLIGIILIVRAQYKYNGSIFS